ncbi:MAG: protein kinase domain-containing protein [Bacteroidota bacterium]
MAGFAQVIRSFQNGGLSVKEFFALIDKVLASDQGNSGRLLAILKEEHTSLPLPPNVYDEVQRRIESRVQADEPPTGDETRVQPPGNEPLPSHATPSASGESTVFQPDTGQTPVKGLGDTLNGRFVLEECLGFGGMGMVYKALDLRKLEASDRKPYIAIKVLNVHFQGHPKSLIALQREAKKAQTLAHPNIVTVYDFDRDGTMVYLTMEFLAGKPLSQVLRAADFKGMPSAEALPIINGVGKALAYAHERGFVHCDLKPANIFLTDNGEVKVIDFGIARVFHKPDEDVEATVFDPGSLGGLTPTYASPEMLEHRDPDPRDDIYALGCISYELLTGRHPFNRLPATQARSEGIRPSRPKTLDRRQWRALQSALSFDRAARTPSVGHFLREMNGERRSLASLALAASILVVALGAGGLAWYMYSETPEQAVPPPVALAQLPAAVAPILAGVPCSALAASVRDGGLLVQGFLPRHFNNGRLREMLGAAPGISRLDFDVHPVSDEDCDVVSAFAPYWKNNREGGRAVSIAVHGGAKGGELHDGDSLMIDVTTPAYDSYVNIDYYQLDGSVVHMVPSLRARDNQAPPNYSATIGSLGNWVVAKPFGKELIVLLTTPVPLFESMRPEHEAKADYLLALNKQLIQIGAQYGADRLTADIVQITTRPKP